ncbi:hypothetical protein [Candidatus Tisiphia endosymbiont of Nemotelus uliginosus]|uniref:hypothetical protein n=1 Tax=Candidatus Tisiphia endosymbiont of Nemotelus uliginosus TaxID=3077926 RepID=UPI0035C88658
MHEAIIGNLTKEGYYNIVTAQNLIINGRDTQANSPYTDNDSINFGFQASEFNISITQSCEVTLGAPVKADVDGYGCVYLNSNNNVLSVKGESLGTPDCKLKEIKGQGNIQIGVEHYAYDDNIVSIVGNNSEAIVE